MVLAAPFTVPPDTCTAQGKVCPDRVTDQAPMALVAGMLLSAAPAAHVTLTAAPTIGAPTAAVPLKVVEAAGDHPLRHMQRQ